MTTTDIITSQDSAVILSEIASNAGAIMLANGAEIYRVEDTVERIIRSKENIKDVDVYSAANVIIISFSYKDEIHTNIRRVKARTHNLYFINKVNSFSRNFVRGDYTLQEAWKELQHIKNDPGQPMWMQVAGSAISAGAFLLLLGGHFPDVLIAFFVGLVSYIISNIFQEAKFGFFLVNFIAGLVVSIITLSFKQFIPTIEVDKIVIASMMAFLPGITLTNAMRDLMSGDVTSGLTGATTAILISTALALGVAMPITIVTYIM